MRNVYGCRPSSLEEALGFLRLCERNSRTVKVVAGGTDVMPRAIANPGIFGDCLLDVSSVEGLSGISESGGRLLIGPCCTHSFIASSDLVRSRIPMLAKACASIGSPQIRNRGTIGGNICNASPVGDTLPSLYVLDAEIRLESIDPDGKRSVRIVPVSEFIKGPGRTVISPCELLTGIFLEIPGESELCEFRRSMTRKALSITKASVAFRADIVDGVFRGVRIALGSVGPVIMPAHACERVIEGSRPGDDLGDKIEAAVMEDCSPIDDIRSTREYRRHVVAVFLRRIVSP